jgi:phosphoenolpyruvate carboxylase
MANSTPQPNRPTVELSFAEVALSKLYDAAVSEKLLSSDALAKYKALRHEKKFTDTGRLEEYIATFKGMSEEDKLGVSRLMGLECQMMSALHAGDRKQRMDGVKDNIRNFLSKGLNQAKESRESFIKDLANIKEEMLISIIHTTHPTVYHSPESIKFETALTTALETQDKSQMLSSNGIMNQIDSLVRDRVREVKTKPISHSRKITVTEENEIEQDNIRKLKEYQAEFERSWKSALDELHKDTKLSEEEKKSLEIDKLKVEWRTWGMGSDADGRPNSTSIELFNSIEDNKDAQGRYKGSTLDLRQNANEHADVVSGLIQRLYSMSERGVFRITNEFKQHCETFIKGINTPEAWKDPKQSILQELTKDQQAEFIKQTINQGFELLPKNVAEETVEFNKQFHPLFNEFVHSHKVSIQEAGYDENKVTYVDLAKIKDEDGIPLQNILAARVYKEIHMKGGQNFNITPEGYYMHMDHKSPTFLLLSRGRKIDADGDQQRLLQEERVVLVDVLKRLQIVNHEIDNKIEGGNVIADRHQIANFAHERDFYALLSLFKETGLVEMEYQGSGKNKQANVTKAKIGIQPLLETSEDMRKAPEMFEKLLKDPLARSYYQKRGIGEFMVGFSDGARSASNFSSEWEIHQCMKKLNKVFEDAKLKPPVPLRFFRGHGRGADRGGPLEYGIEDYVLPDIEAAKAVRDETWQSDLPLDMRMSPAYGADTFAQTALGTMQAALVARQKLKNQQPVDQARDESYETAIDFIAKAAEKKYRDTISNDELASENDAKGALSLKFIKATPDNGDKTSRPAVRNSIPSFQKTRAIGVEYGFNMAGLPAHNVGLAQALSEFIKSGPSVKAKDGRELKGEDALVELYQNSRFFRGAITKISKGMDIYNPEVARRYAKTCSADVQEHVEGIIKELDALPALIFNVTQKAKEKEAKEKGIDIKSPPFITFMHSDKHPSSDESVAWSKLVNRDIALTSAMAFEQRTLALMSQGLLLSYDGNHAVKKDKNPNQFETVRNAVFVSSERVSNRYSSPELRNMAEQHVR